MQIFQSKHSTPIGFLIWDTLESLNFTRLKELTLNFIISTLDIVTESESSCFNIIGLTPWWKPFKYFCKDVRFTCKMWHKWFGSFNSQTSYTYNSPLHILQRTFLESDQYITFEGSNICVYSMESNNQAPNTPVCSNKHGINWGQSQSSAIFFSATRVQLIFFIVTMIQKYAAE